MQGWIQDFHWGGGGGGKRWCACMHITSVEPNSLSARVQGPQKGPGSFRVVLMLSRAIWALFLSIVIKNWIKIIVDPILGGCLLCPSPPGSATMHVHVFVCHCLLLSICAYVCDLWDCLHCECECPSEDLFFLHVDYNLYISGNILWENHFTVMTSGQARMDFRSHGNPFPARASCRAPFAIFSFSH